MVPWVRCATEVSIARPVQTPVEPHRVVNENWRVGQLGESPLVTPASLRGSIRQHSCPAAIQSGGHEGIRATSEILVAVKKGVPRLFCDYTTQGGGPGWHHYQVLGLLSLSGGYLPEPRAPKGSLTALRADCRS